MAEIDADRRAMLAAKHGIYNSPDPKDRIAQAAIDGDRIAARANWAPDNWLLCDPDRSPAMHDIVTTAHRDLRAAMAAGEIEFDTGHESYEPYEYNPDIPDFAAVLINFVGSREVLVCRRPEPVGRPPWFQHTQKVQQLPDRGPAYITGLLQLTSEVYDLWNSDDCQIRISDGCGGRTVMFPISFGTILLVFRCCLHCQAKAAATTEVGYQIAVMEAHERAASAPLSKWAKVRHDRGIHRLWRWLGFGLTPPPRGP